MRRYRAPDRPRPLRHAPVLLVPPLAAPASCFDLRKGCSIVEHLLARGYPTYLVDYGPISFNDRDLGLEHWVDDVIPKAVKAVSEDCRRPAGAGGRLVPGRDHGAARRRRPPRAADQLDRADREPVRLREGAADGADQAARRPDRRPARVRPLPRARRRARDARLARLPRHRDRPLRHEAGLDRAQPRQPRAARAHGGRGRLHGEHARLPRAAPSASSTTASSASTSWRRASSSSTEDREIDLARGHRAGARRRRQVRRARARARGARGREPAAERRRGRDAHGARAATWAS